MLSCVKSIVKVDRDTDKNTEIQTDRYRQRHRQTGTDRDTDRQIQTVALFRSKRRHIFSKVRAAMYRPVLLKLRLNIPPFPKAVSEVGVNR